MQFVPAFLEGQLVLCIKNLQLNIIWLSIFSGIFSKMIPQRCINVYTQTWSPLHYFFLYREHLVTNDLNVDQVKSGLISSCKARKDNARQPWKHWFRMDMKRSPQCFDEWEKPHTKWHAVLSCSVVSDSLWLWTVARQAPLSMGLSRQEY